MSRPARKATKVVAIAKVRELGFAAGRRASEARGTMVADMLALMGDTKPTLQRYENAAETFKAGYIAHALKLNDDDAALKVLKLPASKRNATQQAAYKAAGNELSRRMRACKIENPSPKAGNGNAKPKAAKAKAETAAVSHRTNEVIVKSIDDVDQAFRLAFATLRTLTIKHGKLPGMMDYQKVVAAMQATMPKKNEE